jgi:hypothetical protein
VGEDGAPRIGSPEWEAQRLAEDLLKQDAALETLRKREVPAAGEFDADAQERRGWALARAMQHEPARNLGPDRGSEAMLLPNGALMAVRRKDGLIAEMAPAAFVGEVILPHEWDEHDREWRAHTRRTENELLAREYGAEQCVVGGLFTAEEAAQLDPVRSRRPPLPRGVEAL